MRRVFSILMFMLLCGFAFAQKKPFVSIDTNKRLVFKDPINPKDRPYVLINDKEYKGKLENINQGDIASVDVMKGPDAKSIYGEKAANGAILITTKEPVELEDVTLPPSKKKRGNLIVDGEKSDKSVGDFNPDSVMSIDVLVKPKFIDSKIMDTTVVLVTKKYAAVQYKVKLAKYSKEYKAYLDASKTGDEAITYELNNAEVSRDEPEEFVRTLYEIPANKIRSVVFKGRHYMGIGKNEEPIVVITTKNY